MIHAAWSAVWWWWLVFHPPAPVEAPSWDGRVLTRDNVHVGVRPASDALGDYAVTVQITVRTWPF